MKYSAARFVPAKNLDGKWHVVDRAEGLPCPVSDDGPELVQFDTRAEAAAWIIAAGLGWKMCHVEL